MTSPPFQFTLRRMLMAVAYASAAFAIIAWIIRAWQQSVGTNTSALTLITFLGLFAVWVLIGAGIGELHGSAARGARRAVEVPLQWAAFTVAVMFVQLLAVALVGLLAAGVIKIVMAIVNLF